MDGTATDSTAMTRVACCQLRPAFGDPAANREQAADAVARAAAAGAQVVVLPELASSGYVFESRAEARACAEPADGETVRRWARLAAEHDLVIVGGFCELAGEEVFNSAALVDAGGLRAVYRKAHLWDAERLWFTPGSAAPPVVATAAGSIAVMICYDLEFPEWVRLPALAGTQLLCAPVNWPAQPQPTQAQPTLPQPAPARPAGQRPMDVVKVQAEAAMNRMFIAVCDRAGQERGVDWVEGSVIVDADGWPLAGGSASAGETMILAECRLADALSKSVSPLSDVHADRRPDLYAPVAQPSGGPQ
jgi:5-aminopentanamidase